MSNSPKKREIIANIERLNQMMDRDGYAAIVARSGKNFTYLAGFAFPGTLARHLDFSDTPRGVLLIWPRKGKPVMLLNEFSEPVARRDSWLEDIVMYDGYSESVYMKAAEVLTGMGLHEAKLGFEKTFISAIRWEELQGLLPKANIADCTSMMNEVRWVKTPGEVKLIKIAADILDDAYLEVFPTVRDGDTEREIHSRLIKSCLQRGSGWAHGILNSSRNTVMYGGEGDFVFRQGDIIRNDYVLYYQGYPGHQSRTVVLGQPSAELKRDYKVVRDIYLKTMEKCRPGVKAGDIYRFAADAYQHAGIGTPPLAGHGVGAWLHQQEPYLVKNNQQKLESGMVIALEPYIDYWHIQDMILITDDSPRVLSDKFNTEEILTVG
ncbi:M24 family metallopeptidase [Chloroflexota bacterium]